MFVGCVVWTYVVSSSWFYSCYIWCMCCLNFYWVQFLVLLLLYLVYVLSALLYCPVPGLTPVMFGECVVWTFVGSSSWSYSHYILWMWCLNFVRVQFLILFPLYLVDVLSELLYCPVPGLTLVIFGECVVWTFIGSSSWFYSCYIWWMCCLHFCRGHFLVLLLIYLVDVLSEILYGPLPGLTPIIFGGCVVSTLIGSSSWFYSRYIRWMGCLKFYRIQFLVLLLLYLVDVLSELL
jgi:hypothetical protein